MGTLTKTLLTGIHIMINGAVFLFAPKVVVQVVQNKKSKNLKNFLTHLIFCRILNIA